MSKHTPGPWEVNKDYKGRTIIDCNDDNICIMDSLHEVDIKHNARLIAVAPELYEALKLALQPIVYLEDHSEVPDVVAHANMIHNTINALIARIEGKEEGR